MLPRAKRCAAELLGSSLNIRLATPNLWALQEDVGWPAVAAALLGSAGRHEPVQAALSKAYAERLEGFEQASRYSNWPSTAVLRQHAGACAMDTGCACRLPQEQHEGHAAVLALSAGVHSAARQARPSLRGSAPHELEALNLCNASAARHKGVARTHLAQTINLTPWAAAGLQQRPRPCCRSVSCIGQAGSSTSSSRSSSSSAARGTHQAQTATRAARQAGRRRGGSAQAQEGCQGMQLRAS